MMTGEGSITAACRWKKLAAVVFMVFAACPARGEKPFPSLIRLESRTEGYSVYEVRFPTPLPSLFKSDNTVWAHLYLPAEPQKDGKLPPCVLLLPIMAAPNLWIEQHFAYGFVRRKLAVLIVEMPFQFHRKPDPLIPSGEMLLARNPKRMRKNIQQSIADARRAISWLQGSGKVDAGRIGIFGISLGAIIGASVLSQDARLAGGVFLLGGADIPGILANNVETADIVKAIGVPQATLREVFRGIDPLDFKESNRGKRVLLINAIWDHIVRPEYARKLAEAFPGCRQIWVPFGHYSAMLHYFWVRPYISNKFREWLGAS